MARWLTIFLAGVLVAGCAARSSAVRSHGRAGSLRIASTDAAAPATASRQVDRAEVTLPAGTVLEVGSSNPPDGMTNTTPGETYTAMRATLAAPARLVRETTRDELATAPGHAPPSPAELARGWGVKLWGGIGAAFAVLGIVLVARGHGKAAAWSGLGALVVPLVGHWVNSTAGIVAAGVCAAVALTLFAAWHIMRRRGVLAPGAGD